MGRNGIKEKTPSGSISALMSQWGEGGVGMGTRAGSGHPEQRGVLPATYRRGLWPSYSGLPLPTTSSGGNKCTNTTQGPSRPRNSPPVTYELHPRGRKHAPKITYPPAMVSSPAANRWKEHRFSKWAKRGRFCKLQIGGVDTKPSTDATAHYSY